MMQKDVVALILVVDSICKWLILYVFKYLGVSLRWGLIKDSDLYVKPLADLVSDVLSFSRDLRHLHWVPLWTDVRQSINEAALLCGGVVCVNGLCSVFPLDLFLLLLDQWSVAEGGELILELDWWRNFNGSLVPRRTFFPLLHHDVWAHNHLLRFLLWLL